MCETERENVKVFLKVSVVNHSLFAGVPESLGRSESESKERWVMVLHSEVCR